MNIYSNFTIENIPFGIFSIKNKKKRLATIINDQVEIILKPQNMEHPDSLGTEGVKISTSNFKNMYWTVAQQIAHHTVNGCNLNVGDVMASGTISGKEPNSFGSLLELTWGGQNPIILPDGTKRTFLEDGDTVIIKGFAEKIGVLIKVLKCQKRVKV